MTPTPSPTERLRIQLEIDLSALARLLQTTALRAQEFTCLDRTSKARVQRLLLDPGSGIGDICRAPVSAPDRHAA